MFSFDARRSEHHPTVEMRGDDHGGPVDVGGDLGQRAATRPSGCSAHVVPSPATQDTAPAGRSQSTPAAQ
ncbi:hypothetical protein ACH9DO_06495 [Kocuria sp. M1N1S27]